MISVDTNIIVRLLTGDDQSQFQRAKYKYPNDKSQINPNHQIPNNQTESL
jgi:predicted nucleic-acid-binding protein